MLKLWVRKYKQFYADFFFFFFVYLNLCTKIIPLNKPPNPIFRLYWCHLLMYMKVKSVFYDKKHFWNEYIAIYVHKNIH